MTVAVVMCGCGVLSALYVYAPNIAHSWRHSLTARVFRIRVRCACWYLTYPSRLLRKRRPKTTTAAVRVSPIPAPAVPDDVEVTHAADH